MVGSNCADEFLDNLSRQTAERFFAVIKLDKARRAKPAGIQDLLLVDVIMGLDSAGCDADELNREFQVAC